MTVSIRRVRPEELDTVGDLVLRAYDEIGAMSEGYRAELRATARRIDDDTTVLVAVGGAGRLLGTVTSVTGRSAHFEHAGHGDGGFRALAVAPSCQGAGVGRRLVEHVVDTGRAVGWRRIAITTMEWMDAAAHLYARLGFERRPDLDVRYPTGTGLAYTLDLTPDARDHFPAPGPSPDPPPWYEDLPAERPSC